MTKKLSDDRSVKRKSVEQVDRPAKGSKKNDDKEEVSWAGVRPPLRHSTTPQQVDLRGKRGVLVARMGESANLRRCRPETLKYQSSLVKLYKSKMIHRGSRSLIYAGERRSDGLAVVIKKVPYHADILCFPEPDQPPAIFEAAVMEFLNRSDTSMHRGQIPRLVATYVYNRDYFIVMKARRDAVTLSHFCNADLVEKRGRFSEDMAKHILLRLYKILSPLVVSEGVYHGNVTANNILVNLNDMRLQLIDFDWTDNYQSNLCYRTDGVTPPEQLCLPPEAYEGDRVFQADSATTYAMGVLLHRLLAKGRLASYDADKDVRDHWDMPRGLSPQCQEVLKACLASKPKRVAFKNLAAMNWFRAPIINRDKVKEEAAGIKLQLQKLINHHRLPKSRS